MALINLQAVAVAAETHNRRREAEEAVAHSHQTEGVGEVCRRCGVALRQSAR